jgi:hypothetical protein
MFKPKTRAASELSVALERARPEYAESVKSADAFTTEAEQDALLDGDESLLQFQEKQKRAYAARDKAKLLVDGLERLHSEAQTREAEAARRSRYEAFRRKHAEFLRTFKQRYCQAAATITALMEEAKALDKECAVIDLPEGAAPIATTNSIRENREAGYFPPPVYQFLDLPGFEAGEPGYRVPDVPILRT